jgi:TPR repeat protein
MLFDGRGVPRDLAAAATGYRRAAEQGHARAMNLLARCHEAGWGVPRDPARAAHWYRRSAEGGYYRGQFNHATVLASQGDIAAALAWFERALEGASGESLATMALALAGHPDPGLRALGHRYSAP